jgi:hypothetical protein
MIPSCTHYNFKSPKSQRHRTDNTRQHGRKTQLRPLNTGRITSHNRRQRSRRSRCGRISRDTTLGRRGGRWTIAMPVIPMSYATHRLRGRRTRRGRRMVVGSVEGVGSRCGHRMVFVLIRGLKYVGGRCGLMAEPGGGGRAETAVISYGPSRSKGAGGRHSTYASQCQWSPCGSHPMDSVGEASFLSTLLLLMGYMVGGHTLLGGDGQREG